MSAGERLPGAPDPMVFLDGAGVRIAGDRWGNTSLAALGEGRIDGAGLVLVDIAPAIVEHAEYVNVRDAAHMVVGDRNGIFGDKVVEFLLRNVPPDARP